MAANTARIALERTAIAVPGVELSLAREARDDHRANLGRELIAPLEGGVTALRLDDLLLGCEPAQQERADVIAEDRVVRTDADLVDARLAAPAVLGDRALDLARA